MLKEIKPEKMCPECGADLCITGMFRERYFIYYCPGCEKTFIHKQATKGIVKEKIDESIKVGSTKIFETQNKIK